MARKSKFNALQYEMPKIELDITCINKATIYFRSIMPLSSIWTVQVFIPINITNFYVIDTPILFLFGLKNMDTFVIYLNNNTKQLIYQDGKSISTFCK